MASPESSDHPAHGILAAGRIYVRGLGKPKKLVLASGLEIPFGGASEDTLSGTQWAQCIDCSDIYMEHQGHLILDQTEIRRLDPRFPIPSGAVIEFAPNNQWDCTDVKKEQIFFMKPVDYLRWLPPNHPDIPWYIAVQLRNPIEIKKPVAEWEKCDNTSRIASEQERRDVYRKTQH